MSGGTNNGSQGSNNSPFFLFTRGFAEKVVPSLVVLAIAGSFSGLYALGNNVRDFQHDVDLRINVIETDHKSIAGESLRDRILGMSNIEKRVSKLEQLFITEEKEHHDRLDAISSRVTELEFKEQRLSERCDWYMTSSKLYRNSATQETIYD